VGTARIGLCVVTVGLLACARDRRDAEVERLRAALDAPVAIGAEARVDEPVYTDRKKMQTAPYIAPGGPGALVIWYDEGDSPDPNGITYAARLDASGALLDPVGIPMTQTPGFFSQTSALAAWNGDRALVIWSESPGLDFRIRAARIGADGTLMDPGGFDVATGGGDEHGRSPKAVIPVDDGFVCSGLSPVLPATSGWRAWGATER